MGSRLIFARIDRRQCHCSPPLEMVGLPSVSFEVEHEALDVL